MQSALWSAVISAIILSSSASAQLLLEDFNDGVANGWQVYTSGWSVVSGTYRGTNTAPNTPVESYYAPGGTKPAWTDIQASARFSPQSTNQPSDTQLLVRYNSTSSGLMCQVLRSSGYTLYARSLAGQASSGVAVSITVGQWYTLRATVTGAQLTCEIVGIPSATQTFTFSSPPASGTIALRATHAPVYFDDVTVTSNSAPPPCNQPTINTQPQSQSIMLGQSASLSVSASGDPTLAYQWYLGSTGNTTQPIGVNSSTYSTGPLILTASYWVKVSNSCGSTNSGTATITVQPPVCQTPLINQVISPGPVPSGQSTTLSVEATGSSLIFEWFEGSSGDTSRPVGSGNPWTTPILTTVKNYWVRVRNACGTTNSPTISLTIECAGSCVKPRVILVPGILGTRLLSSAGKGWISNSQIIDGLLGSLSPKLTDWSQSRQVETFRDLQMNPGGSQRNGEVGWGELLNLVTSPAYGGRLSCALLATEASTAAIPFGPILSSSVRIVADNYCSNTIEVYNKLHTDLRNNDYEVITYPYDWRRDLPTLGAQFLNFLNTQNPTASRPIAIVAHSLGGLVTAHALKLASSNHNLLSGISAIVTLGTPYQGITDSYLKLQGWKGLGAPGINGPAAREIGMNWPVVYYGLPRYRLVSGADNDTIYSGSSPYPALPAYSTYRQAINDFWSGIANLQIGSLASRFYAIVGTGLNTPTNVGYLDVYIGSKLIREFQSLDANGDGTVALASGIAPNWIPQANFRFLKEEHAKLPRNSAVIAAVRNVLQGNDPGLSRTITQPKDRYKITSYTPLVGQNSSRAPENVALSVSATTIDGSFTGPGVSLIPDSEYLSLPQTTVLYVPADQPVQVSVTGESAGVADLLIEKVNAEGAVTSKTLYQNVQVAASSKGTIDLRTDAPPQFNYDPTGSGTTQVIPPTTTPAPSTSGLVFVPLTPCRVMETRAPYNFEGRAGSFGPPAIAAASTRTLNLPESTVCSIPATAKAYVLNATLIPTTAVDFVTVYPAGETRPNTWTLRSPDGQIVANTAIVKAGTNGGISVYSSNNADMLLDISGYYTEPANATSGLVYYPLSPCRVVDTRAQYRPTPGDFGPPSLAARQTRKFHFPSTPYCSVPTAAAYSVTLTVVPPASLAYLTAWPDGRSQPNVSSINSFSGRVLANSVIVPASPDGSINIFSYDSTDLIVDINGYFAPDDGQRGLYYFPITQCRASDSAMSGGPYPDDSFRTILIPSNCQGVPAVAKAYAINATVIPNANPMPFLTAYPTGEPRPNASILNAFQGQIVSNSAIIPSGINGAIDVYVYRQTNVVLELSGYLNR